MSAESISLRPEQKGGPMTNEHSEAKPESCYEYLDHREIQIELSRLLGETVDFLEENQLAYTLYAGTLLGAVRHGGFIPWDNDVDIGMPRPDYNRLIEVSHKLPKHLKLFSSKNSGMWNQFLKVCDTRIRAQELAYEGLLDEYLWVDIFPFDGVPADDRRRNNHLKRVTSLLKRRCWLALDPKISKSVIKRMVKTTYKCLASGKEKRIEEDLHDLLTAYPYEHSEFIACYAADIAAAWKLPRSEFEKYREIEFDGRMYKAMGCAEEYLTMIYGNYMKLPPEQERISHCMKVWRVGNLQPRCREQLSDSTCIG